MLVDAAAPATRDNVSVGETQGIWQWLPDGEGPADNVDVYAGFRFKFSTVAPETTIVVTHVGVSWYNLYIDGERAAEGPTRFVGKTPYFDTTRSSPLKPGSHVVCMHAHSANVQTRILLATPPQVWCAIASTEPASAPISAVTATCLALPGYKRQWSRMSPLLGWMENLTVSKDTTSWLMVEFNDAAWVKPAIPPIVLDDPVPLLSESATSALAQLTLSASGHLWERYGYANDDPAARFALRLLQDTLNPQPKSGDLDYGPPQGLFWRFDAMYARLLRPVLWVTAPAGAIVEVCYSQALIDGKVSPFHPLCGGPSSYLDRYTIGADAGDIKVEITPLEPRGCRYVEVHVIFDDAVADITSVSLELPMRSLLRGYAAYHTDPLGAFSCPDMPQLGTIWETGIVTSRSCVEDTCIDGPCRERGEWTGDTLAVTLPVLAACYADLGPIKTALTQTAKAADHNGVITGNCPEGDGISDYDLIWFEGAVSYFHATGDLATLRLLYPKAQACMGYFMSATCYDPAVGFNPPYSKVIDWGYTAAPGFAVDLCLQAMLVSALNCCAVWATAVGDLIGSKAFRKQLNSHSALLNNILGLRSDLSSKVNGDKHPCADDTNGIDDWLLVPQVVFDPSKLGFHACALLLRCGILGAAETAACVTYIKSQLSAMFPNDRTAPRLSDPGKRSPSGFYTPYFQTFTFDALFRVGEADFCIGQYQSAWGWALTQASTWLEVFDPRWEVVHSWSSCPTWQLSRFLLGLTPRYDVGLHHFDFQLHVGTTVQMCSGKVPTRPTDPASAEAAVSVSWKRVSDPSGKPAIEFTLSTPNAVYVKGWPIGVSNTYQKISGTATAITTTFL